MVKAEHAKLTLHLGGDLKPYESTFNGENVSLTYENRQFKVTEEGLRGFYLVIGHALLNRLRKETGKEAITLPVQGDEITSAVHEMIRETGLAATPWLHSIFNGRNPKSEGYLNSRFPRGRKIVSVNENLALELRFHESVKGLKARLLKEEEVENFYFKYLPDSCKTIDLDIDGVRGKGRSSGEAFHINNRGHENVLSRGDLLHIRIEVSYPTNLVAYWINTKKAILKLHPRTEAFRGGGTAKFEKLDSGGRRLKLPELPVGARGGGTEICIVLLKAGTIKEEEKISSRISRFIKDDDFEVSYTFLEQDSRTFKLEAAKREFAPISADLGLDELIFNEFWSEELAENLHGFGDKLVIFTIPNKTNAL